MTGIKLLECTDIAELPGLLAREEVEAPDVENAVSDILKTVKREGDAALLDYTRRFDGVALDSLKVTKEEIEAAVAATDADFLAVLKQARDNIAAYHQKQKRTGFVMTEKPGVVLGQRVIPLDKVGLYVPGGTARYPSTVLMDAVPAKIAGVGELVMTTPPGKDGAIPSDTLAAAYVAGVDTIFKLGGAQAVAALAYGTETVPRVDKIVGPGNIYVATAKRMVFGLVDIEMIAGPSDILVIADESANPVHVAADLLSQAEHDKLSSAVLVTTSGAFAGQVRAEVAKQLEALPRKEIASSAIERNSAIIVTDTLERAADISNCIAPEHLELCVREPFALLPRIRHAGSVFLGHYAPEVLGDYFAGPNHTLPTGGTARFSSPLSVDDFCKKSSFLYYQKEALAEVADQIVTFAGREGLEGHANSVIKRFEEEKS